jgi:NitT/TauT family transport system permease protein
MKNILKYFSPNFIDKLDGRVMMVITLLQIVLFTLLFQFNGNELIPKPLGISSSIAKITSTASFYDDFIATLFLIIKGMGMAIFISLILCYLSLIPAFKGITTFVSRMRFLTYTGLLFVFTIMIRNGSDIKISLLLFGIIPYFVTSLLSYIDDTAESEYQLCFTMKLNKWQTLYEVIIKGKLHLVLEVIRQNFAIAWMMITSVEGLSMSEGGLGTMMIKSNKYLHIDDVFAVLTIIFVVGILFDYLFSVLKVWIFPYTDTKRYSKLLINRLFTK